MLTRQSVIRFTIKQLLLYSLLSLLLASYMVNVTAARPPGNKPQPVIVAPVQLKEISDRIEALGTLRANESVNITSNVTEKIRAIHFEDGQSVQKGDVLVVLEQSEEQANLEQARALHDERQLALNRLIKLEKRKLAPTDEVDRARLELQQAKASIAAIQSRINDRVIRAPFAGIVGLRNISIGSLVETGDIIATLDDLRSVKLDFSVPSVFLTELKPGLKIRAQAAALGATAFLGEVKSINSRIDPVSRSVLVRAVLPNPNARLVPGLMMQVDLLWNTRQALLIPEAALLPQGSRQYAMVAVKKQNKEMVEKKVLQIGTRTPGFVEVINGLSVDELVVTHGNSKLSSGGEVSILAVDDGTVDIADIIKGKNTKGKKQ